MTGSPPVKRGCTGILSGTYIAGFRGFSTPEGFGGSMSSSIINSKNSTQGGFTLVEIAIVLVIIGLLLGGILKGQEMITQATIKNKDNDVSGNGGAPPNTAESNLFWQHLRIAGFVPGLTTGTGSGTPPPNAAGGIVGVESAVVGGKGLGFTGLTVCSSNIPDKVAIAMDTQIDDSNSATGQVRAQLQATANPDLAATPATGYVETGVGQYLVCKAY